LFAFAVIIFGTRVWDMLSRPRTEAATTHAEHHEVEAHGSEGDDHGEHGEDDDEDPKVPHLTTGALVSGYAAILIMAAACVYSWVLLFSTIADPASLAEQGITVLSYPWLSIGHATYMVSFHLDRLAIT